MNVCVYCRTSTTDQHPDKQVLDCLAYAATKGFVVEKEDIHLETLSGFKDINRPEYEAVKEKARTAKIKAVIVWAIDRWVRNRDTLLDDVMILKTYGCNLYSVKESWLEAINIPGPIGRTIQDFLLGMIASIAEMESQRRSERTVLAFQRKTGRWGRKPLNDRVVNDVLALHAAGKSMREIAKLVHYSDHNKNEQLLSLGSVHKIIAKSKVQNGS